MDKDGAARIAGYHLTALALIAADPDAEHGRQSLLSAEELHFQIEGLSGPRRELPNCRFHELFEQRARAYPDVVAGVHGERQWTYGELNARANRLGQALMARGLRREGVVAVVLCFQGPVALDALSHERANSLCPRALQRIAPGAGDA